MSSRTFSFLTFLFATFAVVPALATDITPIPCPASCPPLVSLWPKVVDTRAGDQSDPHISGNFISYTDVSNIRYFDLSLNIGNDGPQVPSPPGAQDVLSDISDGKIVFSRVETTGRVPIVLYNISIADYQEVDTLVAQPFRFGSAIGGPTVAFIDFSLEAHGELFVTDYAVNPLEPVTTRLTFDSSADQSPSVSPDGKYVVWESCPAGVLNCDIALATRNAAGSWTISMITQDSNSQANSHVDGQWIVYHGTTGGERDIYIRSIDGSTQLHLVMPGDQRNPSVSRGVVQFESVPVGESAADVYLFQISTGRLWRVTNTQGVDESLNDISVQADGSVNVTWASVTIPALDHDIYAAQIVLPDVSTPTLLQQLIDQVASYNLKQGISNSLDTKLQNAQAALDAARNNNLGAACNLISAFLNEVAAQSGKSITAAQAQVLLDLGLQVKQSLGCA